MIKVTLGEAKTQESKPFPKLMISIATGAIILFRKQSDGTVFFSTENSHKVGYHSDSWTMESFTDYNEPITIQNA